MGIRRNLHNLLVVFIPSFLLLTTILCVTYFIGRGEGYDSMPAVQVLYWVAGAGWMIQARVVIHGVVTVVGLLTAGMMLSRPEAVLEDVFKVRSQALGATTLITSGWNLTMLFAVLYGGPWHFSAFIFGALDSVAVCVTAIILFTKLPNKKATATVLKHTIKSIGISLVLIIGVGAAIRVMPPKLFSVNQVYTGFTRDVRPATRKIIADYAHKYPSIGSISLVSLDFQHNTRTPIIENPVDPEITRLVEAAPQPPTPLPIFTDNSAKNAEMSALLTGKFNCRPSGQGRYATVYHVGSLLTTSCRMPVSPDVGRLVGYLAVHLMSPPTDALKIKLETETRILAFSIYYNEFVPFDHPN